MRMLLVQVSVAATMKKRIRHGIDPWGTAAVMVTLYRLVGQSGAHHEAKPRKREVLQIVKFNADGRVLFRSLRLST